MIPEIVCREENGQYIFDCERCGKTHYHGAMEGHRVSHCDDRDSYPNGYILKKEADGY